MLKSKTKGHLSMMICIIMVFTMLLGIIPVNADASTNLKLSIISDTHLYPSSLGVTGSAFESYIANDRKMIAESEAILNSALETIKNSSSNVVLISGDLTKDGEKVSHELMVQKLTALKNVGKKVYVINGNHDVSNVNAKSFSGSTETAVSTVSPSQFKQIYNDFGYGEAIAQDTNSLSYVVEPISGQRIIAIDACVYSKDGEAVSSKTEGQINANTLTWIKAQIADAKNNGKSIVAMMHHGIVPHFSMQPQFFPEYLIKDYANVANQLADAGLSIVFTGHFHSQDITSYTSTNGNKIYDVETGSTVTYPCPIRTVEINGNSVTTASSKISTVSGVDLKGKADFQTYASDFLKTGLVDQVPMMLAGVLMSQNASLTAQDAMTQATASANTVIAPPSLTLGQFLAGTMYMHYIGDETKDAQTQAIITSFKTNTNPLYQVLGNVADSLATDVNTADNNVTFNLLKKITIFHTNDMHGNLVTSYDTSNKPTGYVIGSDLVATIKNSVPGSILVDGGDATQGNSFASLTKGADVISLMNATGYDVMVAGNHEFDYGLTQLITNAQAATFPMLSANSVLNGNPVLKSITYSNGTKTNNGATYIKEVDGMKVGFFGITTPETATKTNPAGITGVTFGNTVADIKAVSQTQIDALKANGARVIVGIMHLGVDPSSDVTSEKVATALKDSGLNVIIDGHSHTKVDKLVDGVYIAQAGNGGGSVGKVEITVEDAITVNGTQISTTDAFKLTPVSSITTTAASIKASQSTLLAPVVGNTKTSLWGGTINGINEARLYETNLGSLIADSMANTAKELVKNNDTYKYAPVVALQNGGGVRTVIKTGSITKGNVIDVLPFGNSLAFKEITPKILYDAIENGVSKVTAQDAVTGKITGVDGRFPQISGISFEYNPSLAVGSRVTAIYIDGNSTMLNRADTTSKIVLASNDFEIAGGDGYTMLSGLKSIGEGGTLDAVFADYLTMLTVNGGGSIAYPITNGRIKTVGVYNPTSYTATIKVTNVDGGLIAGTQLSYSLDGGSIVTATTNSQGILTIANLSDGPHGIKIGTADEVLVNNYSGAGISIAVNVTISTATNQPKVKNVIMMIPDGMSINATTLARYMLANNSMGKTNLEMDKYFTTLIKTKWANGPITDSAPAGTALSTGVKSISGALGVDANLVPKASILEAAQTIGKATGLIATSEFMHATPAAYSAHEKLRSNYSAIAEQMLNQKLDVLLGTGSSKVSQTSYDIKAIAQEKGYTILNNRQEMMDATSTKLWGDFSGTLSGKNNMSYDMDRDTLLEPSLEDMTKKAIETLNKNPNGFFLMVEGSKVDWAAHANDTVGIVSDVLAFDKAFKAAVDFAKADGNTVVISVTDHGNSGISIGSYDLTSYDTAPFSILDPIKGATKTAEGAMTLVDSSKSDASLNTALTAYGINPADTTIATEIAAFKANPSISTLVKTINKKAYIGYTTSGHTGEDVPLYMYAPTTVSKSMLKGVKSNIDVAKFIASILSVNLVDVTSALFVDATSRGTIANNILTITENGKILVIKANQSIATLDGVEKDLGGQVAVYINSKFYVPQKALDLLK